MRTKRIALASIPLLVTGGLAWGASFYLTPTGEQVPTSVQLCVDTGTGLAVPCSQATSSGGGTGGAVSVANGSDVAQGNTADAAWLGTGSASIIAILKAIYGGLQTAIPTGTNRIGSVTAITITNPSANFTRPGDTNAYTIGDLIANNTAAGSVTPLSWTVNQTAAQGVYIRRVILRKSTTGVTAPQFRLHLYTASPTVTNGDNGAFSSTLSGSFCDLDVNMYTTNPYSDGNEGIGAPNTGGECGVVPSAQTVYGLLEARGAYAPGTSEVFTAVLEVYQP